jgi:membrane protein YqaA with SNARE-associated domain
MKPPPHLPAFDGERLDALDARLAEPWLDVPANFDQQVMAAIDTSPAAVRPRRVDTWARWVLLAAGLAGLGECLSFLAGLWLATAAAL